MMWKLEPIGSIFLGMSAIFLTVTPVVAEATEKTESAIALFSTKAHRIKMRSLISTKIYSCL